MEGAFKYSILLVRTMEGAFTKLQEEASFKSEQETEKGKWCWLFLQNEHMVISDASSLLLSLHGNLFPVVIDSSELRW